MRRLGLLAFGVLLGAFAVSGQDEGQGDALDREIERLRTLLKERIDQRTPPPEERIVLRTFDVGDLCSLIRDHMQPLEDLTGSTYRPPEPESDMWPTSPFQADVLVELIRTGVEPGSWEAEGTGIGVRNNRLFVHSVPRVHGKIGKMLRWCRANMDRRVAVDVAVVPVREGDAALLAGAIEVQAEEARRLGEGALGAVTLCGWGEQNLGGRVGRQVSYVADYDVKIAEGASIGDPIRREVFAGCSAQVLVGLGDGEGAFLECRIELSRVAEPFPVHVTEHGGIELPVKRLTRVLCSFWAPLGRTVVAGGCTVGDEPCVILVTLRKV